MKYGRTMQNTLMVQGNFNSRLEATDKLCYNYNGTGFSKHQPFPHGSNYRLVWQLKPIYLNPNWYARRGRVNMLAALSHLDGNCGV